MELKALSQAPQSLSNPSLGIHTMELKVITSNSDNNTSRINVNPYNGIESRVGRSSASHGTTPI